MKIEVKQEHIKEGKTGSIHSCPVALAITEQVNELESVSVTPEYVRLYFEERKAKIDFPKKVETFINRFDTGKEVKPFSFNLKI